MPDKPEQTVRVGGIQISVWANETSKGTMRSITIDKSYKQGSEWKRTKSYKDTDLPKIIIGLNEVLKSLYLKPEVIDPPKQEAY